MNGMEKDDEIKGGGNSVDFGSRMLDTRLGRWFSADPMRQHYPGMSPYSAFGNCPIYLKDSEGKLLTDPNGNPIFVDNGPSKFLSKTYDNNSGTYTETQTEVHQLTYFTNAGEPVYAYKIISKTITTQDYDLKNGEEVQYNNDGSVKLRTVKNTTTRNATENEMMDCHGYTFIGKNSSAKTWIMSYEGNYSNIDKILQDDGWKDISGTDIKTPQVGDIAIFTNNKGISHSATVSNVDKKGKVSYDSKSEDKQRNGNASSKDLKGYGSVKYYRGGGDKKTDKVETGNTGETKASPDAVKAAVAQ